MPSLVLTSMSGVFLAVSFADSQQTNDSPTHDIARYMAEMKAAQQEFGTLIQEIFQDVEQLYAALAQRGIAQFTGPSSAELHESAATTPARID